MAKSLRNRYSKNLFGTNHQGYHSGAQVYATAATIADFARSGLEGQIGIYLDDNSLKSDALVAGDIFTIAQIRDSELRRTTKMTYGAGNLAITKTDYDAPVNQVSAVGYNGTAGSMNFGTLAVLQEYVISARDTTPGSQPFPVTEGRAVLRTVSGVTEYDVLEAIVEDMENTNDYERNADNGFVFSEILHDATQVAIGTTTLNALNGSKSLVYSAAHGLAVNDFVSIRLVMYQVKTVVNATVVELDRAFTGVSATALATGATNITHGEMVYVNATTELGVRLTSITEDTNFVVSVGDDLQGADLSTVTAWKQGSGASWQVSAIEDEGLVYDGFTTGNYPFVEDYGKPSKFVTEDNGKTYELWFLKYKKITASMAYPNEQAHHVGLVLLSATVEAATPKASFDTVLGT